MLGHRAAGLSIAVVATVLLVISVSIVALSRSEVTTVDDALERYRTTSDAPSITSPRDPSPARTSPRGEPSPSPRTSGTPEPDPSGQPSSEDHPAEVAAPSPTSRPVPTTRPSSPPPAPPGPLRAPTAGVYVFASSGYESVDIAGGRREMPDETPFTLQTTAAGFSTRLQPYTQHVDLREFSHEGAGIHLERWYMERTFFGQTVAQDYRCSGDQPAWTRNAAPGDQTRLRCAWDQRADLEGTSTLQGYEDVALGDGDSVRGVPHLVVDATLTGDVEGHSRLDLWLHPETGQVLREIRDIQVDTPSPFGRVRYREATEFHLWSLTPQT